MTDGFSQIGLIGLGYMGSAMAKRLRERGRTVVGFDIDESKMKAVAEGGVTCVGSPAEAARDTEAVIVCVTSTASVEQAVFGPGGLAEAGSGGKILVDMSTTDAEATRRMAERLAGETGMAWIDAPVSGGPPAAEKGTLAMMAGGKPAVFERAKPLLDDLAAKVTLMGPVGAGQVTKMINQVLCLTLYPILAEALKLGENAGVDVARIPEALGDGYAGSNLLRRMFPRMVARQYEPPAAFARQVLKDLDMVHDLAKKTKTPTPMCDQARALYRLMVARGHGESDPIALLKLFDAEPV
jgi:3-hydroxyisobutyrate dehydrogenase-like beta-hydroxyacid dehydrogenase